MNNAKTPVRAAGPACNGYQKPAVKFPAKPVEEVANEWPVLEVTQAEAWPLAAPTGKTLGFASVVIGGQIALRDIRVVDGSKGLFAAFPQRAYESTEGTKYSDIYLSLSKEQRDAIQEAVLTAWNAAAQGGSRR